MFFVAIYGTFGRYVTNPRGTFIENVKKVQNQPTLLYTVGPFLDLVPLFAVEHHTWICPSESHIAGLFKLKINWQIPEKLSSFFLQHFVYIYRRGPVGVHSVQDARTTRHLTTRQLTTRHLTTRHLTARHLTARQHYISPPCNSPPLHLATFTSRHPYISPPLHFATITFRQYYINCKKYQFFFNIT
jgi:hypothetical protein